LNRILLAVVVAAAVLAGVFYLRAGEEQRKVATAEATASNAKAAGPPSPDVVLAIKPGGPRGATLKPAESKVSPLMRELATGPAKPIHDRLSQKASRTPEENYVLARILEACTEVPGQYRDQRKANPAEARKQFAATVSEKDPDREKRLAAIEKVAQSMCAGFDGIKTDSKVIKDLLDQAAAGGDPKARARAISQQIWPGGVVNGDKLPGITDAQLEGLRDAARSGDPVAMLIAGNILSSTLGDLLIRAGPDERPIDQRAFQNAWTLVACDAGYDCGPNHPYIVGACAQNGNCGAQNLEEYFYFYGNSPQQSQLINEYRTQLARAIQSGDWSYFSFVRSAPPPGSVFVFGTSGW